MGGMLNNSGSYWKATIYAIPIINPNQGYNQLQSTANDFAKPVKKQNNVKHTAHSI